jgi:hypothetical protein
MRCRFCNSVKLLIGRDQDNSLFTRTEAVEPGMRMTLQPLQMVRFTAGSLMG